MAVLYLIVLFVGLIIFLVAGILTLVAGWVGVDLFPWIERPIAVLTQARDAVNNLISWTFDVLMLGVSVLVVIAGILLSLFNRAFGQWSVWAALFVEVSVEAAPPGRWTLRQLQPPDQTLDFSTGRASNKSVVTRRDINVTSRSSKERETRNDQSDQHREPGPDSGCGRAHQEDPWPI